jgi:hypothetical protein
MQTNDNLSEERGPESLNMARMARIIKPEFYIALHTDRDGLHGENVAGQCPRGAWRGVRALGMWKLIKDWPVVACRYVKQQRRSREQASRRGAWRQCTISQQVASWLWSTGSRQVKVRWHCVSREARTRDAGLRPGKQQNRLGRDYQTRGENRSGGRGSGSGGN